MTSVISELRNTTGSSRLYKLRKFLASDYFCALVVLYSVAVICFNWIIPGAFLLAVITGFVFILSDDIVSVFLPIMLIMQQKPMMAGITQIRPIFQLNAMTSTTSPTGVMAATVLSARLWAI